MLSEQLPKRFSVKGLARLLEQDKIDYQAEERKITKKFREHLLTVAEYIKKLKTLNKPYLEKLRD